MLLVDSIKLHVISWFHYVICYWLVPLCYMLLVGSITLFVIGSIMLYVEISICFETCENNEMQ